jgi:hypothetical protein
MMHEILILGGFICCEAAFHHIEKWFKGHEEKFRALRHGTLVAWIFHPSITLAMAEWINHTIAAFLAH